jgi:hypothetical protein
VNSDRLRFEIQTQNRNFMSKVVALKNLIIPNPNMTFFSYYLTYKYLCWIRTNLNSIHQNKKKKRMKENNENERNMKNSKANRNSETIQREKQNAKD